MMTRRAVVILAASLIVGCASTRSQGESGSPEQAPAAARETGIGLTREAALEVCEPRGEREYLSRLRCADGTAPAFERRGSVGLRNKPATAAEEEKVLQQFGFGRLPEGEIDYHMIDLYEVRCREKTYAIYMDMYHCEQPAPEMAPPGLVLASLQ